MKVNITLKGIIGTLLNIIFISWFLWVYSSDELDYLMAFITKSVIYFNNPETSLVFTWLMIATFVGIASLMMLFIEMINLLCFKKSKEELEIDEATKKIRDKYKLIRLEKRVNKLRRKR